MTPLTQAELEEVKARMAKALSLWTGPQPSEEIFNYALEALTINVPRLLSALESAEVRAHQLHVNLALMHFVGMKVTCCWYSPNVFDRNYSAGAINGSATCDCMPCKDWRKSKELPENPIDDQPCPAEKGN